MTFYLIRTTQYLVRLIYNCTSLSTPPYNPLPITLALTVTLSLLLHTISYLLHQVLPYILIYFSLQSPFYYTDLQKDKDQVPSRSEHPLLTCHTQLVLLVTIGHVKIEVNVKIRKMLQLGKNETLMICLFVMVKNLEPTRTSITLEVGAGAQEE